jgi:hypothetical protein
MNTMTMRTMSRFSQMMVSACLVGAVALGCGGKKKDRDAGLCDPGTDGCACIEGSMCLGDLMCSDGLCAGFDAVGLTVSDQAARSCEVVLFEQSTEVLGVDFADGVQGTSVREAPRTAVTFHRMVDEAFAAGSVTVREATGAGGTVELRRVRCFDREGNALTGEPLRLDR